MRNNEPFRKKLINWYIVNCRDLPWRHSKDPYLIWISEIILQQTRVYQGIDYYHRFISKFPDLKTLASASETEVLKLWEGLGYYSRARNLHNTARRILGYHNGIFPREPEELEKLKGIGSYTSAAIASMAFNKPTAVVDGNVLRFFARYFGIVAPVNNSGTKKMIRKLADEIIDKDDPGLFNQAVMEFGALQCIPANPKCNTCCFSEECAAYLLGKVADLPAKKTKKKPSERFFNYLVIQCIDHSSASLILRKRSAGDIWKHLFDFPMIETNKLLNISQLIRNSDFRELFPDFSGTIKQYQDSYKHLLTHRIIHARFFLVHILQKDLTNLPEGFFFTADFNLYPLPVLINRFLSDYGLKVPEFVN